MRLIEREGRDDEVGPAGRPLRVWVQEDGETEVARLRAIVRDVRPLVEAAAVEQHYGYPWAGLAAMDFRPDAESCTAEELAAHAAALAAGAAVQPDEASAWLSPDVHVTRSPWGIGTITVRDPHMLALLARIDEGLQGGRMRLIEREAVERVGNVRVWVSEDDGSEVARLAPDRPTNMYWSAIMQRWAVRCHDGSFADAVEETRQGLLAAGHTIINAPTTPAAEATTAPPAPDEGATSPVVAGEAVRPRVGTEETIEFAARGLAETRRVLEGGAHVDPGAEAAWVQRATDADVASLRATVGELRAEVERLTRERDEAAQRLLVVQGEAEALRVTMGRWGDEAQAAHDIARLLHCEPGDVPGAVDALRRERDLLAGEVAGLTRALWVGRGLAVGEQPAHELPATGSEPAEPE